MRRRRVASASLPWRNALSIYPPKSPSLFSLCRDHLSDHPVVRRNHCVLVSFAERKTLRHWGRFSGAAREYRSADRLHFILPFLETHRGRQRRLLLVRDCRRTAAQRLARRVVSQRTPHVVRLVESVLCWFGGSLHQAVSERGH